MLLEKKAKTMMRRKNLDRRFIGQNQSLPSKERSHVSSKLAASPESNSLGADLTTLYSVEATLELTTK